MFFIKCIVFLQIISRVAYLRFFGSELNLEQRVQFLIESEFVCFGVKFAKKRCYVRSKVLNSKITKNSNSKSQPDCRARSQIFSRIIFQNCKQLTKIFFLVLLFSQCSLLFCICLLFSLCICMFINYLLFGVFTPHRRRRAQEQKCRACWLPHRRGQPTHPLHRLHPPSRSHHQSCGGTSSC